MDHSLRSISYIADINDILVLMAKRSVVGEASNKQQKLICHIFESDEVSLLAIISVSGLTHALVFCVWY